MSHTLPNDAPSMRNIRQLVSGFADAMTGKPRSTDPVLRSSFDENDHRAKPWRRLGDGSRKQWGVFKRALQLTMKELLVKHRRTKYRGSDRLQPCDLLVLSTVLDHFHHATGEMFPSQLTIAEKAGVSRSHVNASLQRLQAHGFLTWVRRTTKVDGAEGQRGPQRKQTSNAYHFDWRRQMGKITWARFWQLVEAGLKAVGTPLVAPKPKQIEDIGNSELKNSLFRLRAMIPNAS